MEAKTLSKAFPMHNNNTRAIMVHRRARRPAVLAILKAIMALPKGRLQGIMGLLLERRHVSMVEVMIPIEEIVNHRISWMVLCIKYPWRRRTSDRTQT